MSTYSTKIDRVFLKRRDGLYQEMWNHYININNQYVLDKTTPGGVYRKASNNEHSFAGEAEWSEPDQPDTKFKLIAVTDGI